MEDTFERLRDALASQYMLRREIGRGGMATVYLAIEKHPKRRVAIKVLEPAVSSVLGRKRFLREVEIARDLDHPRIVPILATGETDGFLYFVMPYVEGETVRHRLARRGPFRLAPALDIARDAAVGLAHAHAKGIVHRDIKPENILLPGGRAMIADFGIAKALDRVGAETLTRTGHALGTPRYMSPEQAAGESVDGRADLFALGCILYEMLFNALPVRQGRMTPEAISNLEMLPAATRAAITKALAYDADKRFADANAFAEALDVAREELIGTPGATFDERTRRKSRIVLASIILAAVFALALLVRQPPVPPLPERPAVLVVSPALGPAADLESEVGAAVIADVIYRLAALSELRVVSNLSAQRVWKTGRSPRDIGLDFGIDVILSVAVAPIGDAGDQVRFDIRPEMYTKDMERRIWSREFIVADTNLTTAPSRVVREVVTALNVSVSDREQQQLDEPLTADVDAFVAFYSGETLLNSVDSTDLSHAIDLLLTAIERDSRLSEAHAALARAHVRLHWVGADPSARRLILGRQALDRAAAQEPNLPRVRMARGDLFFFGQRDYSVSHREYATALIDRPADGELIGRLGATQLRRGEWSDAVRNLIQAARHDPLNARRAEEAALALLWLRRYEEAEEWLDRAIGSDPASVLAYVAKSTARLNRTADTGVIASTLHQIPWDTDRPYMMADPVSTYLAFRLLPWVDDDGLAGLTGALPRTFFGIASPFPLLFRAVQAERLGERALVRARVDSAVALLEGAESSRRRTPGRQSVLALAHAGLGRFGPALIEAEQAVARESVDSDALLGVWWMENSAAVSAAAGRAAEAVSQLQLLLALPSPVSARWLRIDPRLDPVRPDSLFQQLIN